VGSYWLALGRGGSADPQVGVSWWFSVSFEAAPAWRVWYWFGGVVAVKMKRREGEVKKFAGGKGGGLREWKNFRVWARWIMISIFENVSSGACSVWVCEFIQTYYASNFF